MTRPQTSFEANPAERLVAPTGRLTPRARFLALLAACLLIHAGVLAFLLIEDALTERVAPPEQEIPVEVVVEPPPPEQKPEPPEEQAEKEEPKKQPEKEPPPKTAKLDEKPATDAPRAVSKEKSEQDAPDQEAKAPREAKPAAEGAPKTETEKTPTPEQPVALKSDAPAPADEKPDAETIDAAAPKPDDKPEPKQPPPEALAKTGEKGKSIAEQVASLAPLPDYKFSGAAKPSPVAGGSAETSYLTILYGIIMPYYRPPPQLRSRGRSNKGIITFYIDPRGNLIHQAMRQSSGLSELDAIALAAIKRAGPFPPPPTTLPVGVRWEY